MILIITPCNFVMTMDFNDYYDGLQTDASYKTMYDVKL